MEKKTIILPILLKTKLFDSHFYYGSNTLIPPLLELATNFELVQLPWLHAKPISTKSGLVLGLSQQYKYG